MYPNTQNNNNNRHSRSSNGGSGESHYGYQDQNTHWNNNANGNDNLPRYRNSNSKQYGQYRPYSSSNQYIQYRTPSPRNHYQPSPRPNQPPPPQQFVPPPPQQFVSPPAMLQRSQQNTGNGSRLSAEDKQVAEGLKYLPPAGQAVYQRFQLATQKTQEKNARGNKKRSVVNILSNHIRDLSQRAQANVNNAAKQDYEGATEREKAAIERSQRHYEALDQASERANGQTKLLVSVATGKSDTTSNDSDNITVGNIAAPVNNSSNENVSSDDQGLVDALRDPAVDDVEGDNRRSGKRRRTESGNGVMSNVDDAKVAIDWELLVATIIRDHPELVNDEIVAECLPDAIRIFLDCVTREVYSTGNRLVIYNETNASTQAKNSCSTLFHKKAHDLNGTVHVRDEVMENFFPLACTRIKTDIDVEFPNENEEERAKIHNVFIQASTKTSRERRHLFHRPRNGTTPSTFQQLQQHHNDTADKNYFLVKEVGGLVEQLGAKDDEIRRLQKEVDQFKADELDSLRKQLNPSLE
eukprot:CAMPEP_0170931146 /NCGR_PEP_ID=MMETSP0735-20130129/15957_1 /TAXON_ID=186038 /ORGANISM="Fragilariopsis kerguelensis, Strain L26-C5" /LENGTH=523 /DNA_ID=CAMNT_0011332865 /DNA_START=333 /DNA_END=1904 /DNA_ORIENTATION=+